MTKSYPNERDCEHGSMRGKCDICEYEQDIKELKAKVAELEQVANELESVVHENHDLLRALTDLCEATLTKKSCLPQLKTARQAVERFNIKL